jgi:Trp operon repressor
MQEGERDILELLIFDEIEETVGTRLRAIIQRLEKEQAATRRDQQEQPTSAYETLRGTPLHQKHHPKSAKPTCPTALDRRRVLRGSDRSGFSKLL